MEMHWLLSLHKREYPLQPDRYVLRRSVGAAFCLRLGIMPYISASIILQLLTVVIPYLDRLHKEGEIGRKEDRAIYALWALSSSA